MDGEPSDSTPAPAAAPFPILPTLIAFIAIGGAAVGVYFGFLREKVDDGGGMGSAGGSSKIEFTDPSTISELQIKAVRPQGETSWAAVEVPAKPAFTPDLAAHGKELFGKACAGCHGAEGKGDGPVPARYEFPSNPADLTRPAETVKIRTTMMGSVPRDNDLFRTITRGMPGTAMWSFRDLPPADRWALVAYLKTLSATYGAEEPPLVEIPAKLPRSDELLDKGQFKFRVCANCHGLTGNGVNSPMKNSETGKPYTALAWARNGGKDMLSGSSEEDFVRTLLCGFHKRSPMLTFKVYYYGSENPTPEQKAEGDKLLWGTVYYCRDLLKN